MLEFITGAIVGMIVTYLVLRTMALIMLRKIQKQLHQVLAEAEESAVTIRARVEEHDGVFYFYNNESNEFLVQGSNLQELIDHIEARKPGATVHVVKGDESTIAQLKALAK